MRLFSNQYLDDRFSADAQRALGDDAILRLLPYLRDEDRILMELSFRAHLPRQEVGRILGVPAGTITRRIQRLQRRLHNPIARALLETACPLSREHRQVALDYYLQGLNLKQLTDKHHLSAYVVREILSYAKGWFRGVRMSLAYKSMQ